MGIQCPFAINTDKHFLVFHFKSGRRGPVYVSHDRIGAKLMILFDFSYQQNMGVKFLSAMKNKSVFNPKIR